MSRKCLYCYEPLEDNAADYHTACSRSFFGTDEPPALDYTLQDMQELAREIVIKGVAVTGVQPKLSLEIEKPGKDDPKNSRFTLVGMWGNYILKPPAPQFESLPENEDLTMHLAKIAGISMADHSLIRMKSGELAYITRRFDRKGDLKVPMEDMCQLTETLTENKYHGSMEKIGKHLVKYCSAPGLDGQRLFTLTLFDFITGNADMHLKNFSLVTSSEGDISLSPAYDLVNTKLAMPKDQEEIALTINGKKAKLRRRDFDMFAQNLKIPARALQAIYEDMKLRTVTMLEFIGKSFLPEEQKELYKQILQERLAQLELL